MALALPVIQDKQREFLDRIFGEPSTQSSLRIGLCSEDRRSRSRYPLELDLRFRVLSRGRSTTARFGRCLNMSSQGIFVWQDEDLNLPIGTRVESVLDWPVRLHGEVRLKLVTIGKVVRGGRHGFAVEFKSHEFRTAKNRSRVANEPTIEVPSLDDTMHQILGVGD